MIIKKTSFINVLLIFISSVLIKPFYTYSEEFCDYQNKTHNVIEMIELIKVRLNISSLKCRYTSILINNDQISPATFDFIYQEENCVRSREKIYPEEIQRNTENNTPKNLLELLSKRLSKEKGTESGFEIDYHYYYNGEFYIRYYPLDFDENEIIRIGATRYSDPSGPRCDPRWVLGYFGLNLGTNNGAGPFRKIQEFLDTPGPFFYYEQDKYKVLWHTTTYYLDKVSAKVNGTDKEEVDLEIWVDENGFIVKLQEGAFWTRRHGQDYVKKILGEGYSVNYNFPSYIWRIFEFHDIKEFDNGAQLPLRGVFYRGAYPINTSCFKTIKQEYDEGNINKVEMNIKVCAMCENITKPIKELIIHPEGLSVNIPLPENLFIPPKLSLERRFETEEEFFAYHQKQKEIKSISNKSFLYIPKKGIIFIISCLFLALILMYSFYRYFGWSFF